MTDAQTEARAIARCVRGCATDDQYVELIEKIATALAAKDAELEKVKAECDKWREAFGEMHRQTMRAEAQLAEDNKALEDWWAGMRPSGWSRDRHAENPHVNLSRDGEKALADIAARRALKAENERLKKALSDQEKEMDDWVEAKDAEIEASFDAGHYRAMSEHTTPWKIRAEAAERALAERAGGVKELAADLTELLRCIDQVQGRPATESVYGIYNPNSPFGRIVEKVRTSVDALTTEPAAPATSCYECGHELNGPYCPKCRPAAPEGRREAVRIGDAVLDWMVKFDLLDAGNEYYVSDVLAVLNDLTPSTRPAEQAVTEAKPVAFRVHDFHVARIPMKARGKFDEPTEYFYPASRENDARETARIMGATCTPLYAGKESE